MNREARSSVPTSSMCAALDAFVDLLPDAVARGAGAPQIRSTLKALPQVFMTNGFGVEHDVAGRDSPARNRLSVSVATEFDGLGRLNLARFVDKYIHGWLAEGTFEQTFMGACRALAGHREAAVFPERCYFGFETTSTDGDYLSIPGIVWAYGKYAGKLGDFGVQSMYQQLLGKVSTSAQRSVDRIQALCDGALPYEIGYGVRHGHELYKAYPFQTLGENLRFLDSLDSGSATRLRSLLEALAARAPDWRSFCPLDVVDGELVRVGFEFNLERERGRYQALLAESRLVDATLCPSFRAAVSGLLASEPVQRSSSLGERCSFELTHLKVSVDRRGEIRWKAYFAFRCHESFPRSVPLLTPWVGEA